ncbi:MAG: hypothetical protein FDX21_03855 [Chlorobium sp.]|nr:MAG: hypothetical protein FDX21_03855 [Chlorobium sp.]
MLSKKNVTSVIESSQQHAEKDVKCSQKREWADPEMAEVMNATAVRNGCAPAGDGPGCGSVV